MLARTVQKLKDRKPVRIVVLGDSISTGCNASGWAEGPPFQPAYPELVRRHLHESYGGPVELTNLSVGGMDLQLGSSRWSTRWWSPAPTS
ncbi:MAG: hypothetical protein U0835_13820 [Isosphaeraceae bacterium]